MSTNAGYVTNYRATIIRFKSRKTINFKPAFTHFYNVCITT
jgi:hypothetical protein